jgi:hypothetical protein
LLDRSIDGGCCASVSEPELPGETAGGFEAIEGDRREQGGTVFDSRRRRDVTRLTPMMRVDLPQGDAFGLRGRPWQRSEGKNLANRL